ncbi:MAG: PEPxxWA-CTERM sorting domain-containing protein [Alphaproteobacteria bacterium]|nr:PEPxxWA-CTERM sorting domain-containing protein [Alphaproteobacteria bacterium]MBU1513018.1 PEPxxWA-CTERM sorting domain-containing protein [Alphaproteobacteria bacterium]MBU2095126.1 PEPxxWA-CTERM sorting domain-containing protein [Alphaproteobacteria bacterium]MBU2152133.1 PEPxxWA-CTERM sorting domain-containing protein [Alphaproteobacteria bacterium]MBU2306377.1 PEPxxWA-CTERM sorting domain-containing protein [Alphaproteobacteria bacterium]
MKLQTLAAVAAFATLFASTASAAVTVTYGAPGQQNTTVPLAISGVETFDARSGGDFTTDFGTGGVITGSYSSPSILAADQYGGAGGTGAYAMTWSSYQLDLTTTQPGGVNYLGLWLSAVDAGNTIQLFNGSTQLFTLTGTDVMNALADDWHYKGNPTDAFKDQDYGEKFVFVNLASTTAFDRVVFSASGGGLETDNHTVGYAAAPVPEPTTWIMMIVGFGGVGGMLRARRRLVLEPARAPV